MIIPHKLQELTVHSFPRLLHADLSKPTCDPHASSLLSDSHKVTYPVNSPGIRGVSIVFLGSPDLSGLCINVLR